MTVTATVLGYPRQGPDRHLKKLIEGYWAGRLDAAELLAGARQVRRQRWQEMHDRGLEELPGSDFSLYDHVLDTAFLFGAVPERHRAVATGDGAEAALARYFAAARGTADVAPLEMTKWFDTNYHHLVPELGPDTGFTLDASTPLAELAEAAEAGVITRPVVMGPVSFLRLSKPAPGVDPSFDPLGLLDRLLPCYAELLRALAAAGAGWVQLDEPVLALDQPPAVLAAVDQVYRRLTEPSDRPRIVVASYFDRLGAALPVLAASPVEGLALDFTGPAAANLPGVAALGGIGDKRLIAGVVDGRNVWRTDLTAALTTLGTLLGLAARVDVAASCSLLHVPLDVDDEKGIDPQVAPWFCFARQKLDELAVLARELSEGRDAIAGELQRNRSVLASRASSPITRDPAVRARVAAVTEPDTGRTSPYDVRSAGQRARLDLPVLPTTTIGSFPQTAQLRRARADLRSGRLDQAGYRAAKRAEIASVVAEQERIGLDVLVHGEPERNDMVQYFAEQLAGYVVTAHGWVQSYGTRYVRPPILAGDISRPAPITVEWTRYAQSLTGRPVKGMLTGPVTMLAWSFVRDDQPLVDTATQVALALRDEVLDLEAAGTAVIQVDEPALRETLPLRAADRAEYLDWAVRAFRLTTAGVADDTQVHTHMCYADFGDILTAIIDLDADVISLEASRSDMSITRELTAAGYPFEIGPGVWDIHSPRVPSAAEIAAKLRDAAAAFPVARLWANPDCGLKTRGYPETRAALANLVQAARTVREGR